MFTDRSVTIEDVQKSIEPSLRSPRVPRLSIVQMPWALRILLPVAVLHAVLFLVTSRNGLDLTDESFYLMYFRYWRNSPIFSLFGAYFEIPYLLVGGSIWAIRVFGFALISAGGFWFACELFRSLEVLNRQTTSYGVCAPAIAAAATVWSYYGGYPIPYTPSYNVLSLTCLLFSIALSLRIGRRIYHQDHRRIRVAVFVLGLIASISIANKFTAGLLLLFLNGLIVLAFGWHKVSVRFASMSIAAFAMGLVTNWLILLTIDPDIVVRLQRGIAIQLSIYPRNPLTELMTFGSVVVPNGLAVAARILMWPTLFGLLTLGLGWRTSRRHLTIAIAIAGFVIGALLDTYVKNNQIHRIVLMTMIAILLAAAAMWTQHQRIAAAVISRSFMVSSVILCAPFAYSFGTLNSLIWHMGMAAIFPATLAISHIRTMGARQLIPGWTVTLSLCAFSTLPAEIAIRQWTQETSTYRLGAALTGQTAIIEPNVAQIQVKMEPRVASGIADFLKLTRESGFKAGQPMIDFTGQSPGLVLVCGGFPVGATWLIGGSPFDGDTGARTAIGYVAPQVIRKSWFLTSRNSFARIASWEEIVHERIGDITHEQVGHVSMPDPTTHDKSKTMEVTLWRPRSSLLQR